MPRISHAREAAVRRRILDAAVAAFEAQGFERASMAAIAARAGLSAGGLYTHFAGKDELFLAAFAAVLEDEERALAERIADDLSTRDRIRLAVEHVVEVVTADPGSFRGAGAGFLIHAWASAPASPPIREALADRRGQARRLARLIVDDGIRRGELDPRVDAAGLAAAIPSLLDGLFLQRAEYGAEFTAEEARRQAYAVVDAILPSEVRS